MAKRILLYNLADNMTDEKFKEYVVRKYELLKVTGAMGGKIPFKYVGIVHVTSLDEFDQKAAKTQKYQDFQKKFGPMVKDLLMLTGEEIY